MSRMPITSGRYVPVIINGQRQWARDQVALQAEILSLLERDGAMTKKRIITSLSTEQAAIETALVALSQTGQIESYKAMSARNRLDQHWCIAGHSPGVKRLRNADRYNAIAILAAMQKHAASLLVGVPT